MADKTQYYQLKQWEPGEGLRRTVENENLGKIDTALHAVKAAGDGNLSTLRKELAAEVKTLEQADSAKCELATGIYLGNGDSRRFIDVGFRPATVLLTTPTGWGNSGRTYGGVALEGYPAEADGRVSALEVSSTGFLVKNDNTNYALTNSNGGVYYYVAFCG